MRWLCCLLLTACSGPAADPQGDLSGPVPDLEIEGRDTSLEHAIRIEQLDSRRLRQAMVLLGLEEPGDTILLVLAPEQSLAARSTPSWVSGFALSDRDVAVLFPARTPSYPDSTFEELVLHELGHILVHRAAGGRPVPRWFNEGLALYIGRPWHLEDYSRVTWALVSGREVALADLEPYFHSSREAAGHAYALAGAFIQDLVRRDGPESVGTILTAVAAGNDFDTAFEIGTGRRLADAEHDFWNRHTFLYRWVPVIGSSATLWLLITALALWAFRRRRLKTAALEARWADEERLYRSRERSSGDDGPVGAGDPQV